jgi:putative aldouronate transport system permease protein
MIKQRKKTDPFELIIGIILTLWAVIIIFPFFNVIALSFVTEIEYLKTPYLFFPKKPTLENYIKVFGDNRILIGYRTTLLFLLIGLPYNMFLTVATAYALSRPVFPGKKFLWFYIIFTMYFGGGIVPMYMWIRDLGLVNTIWAVILPSGVGTFYMIITRNYFSGLPPALLDSARIDGAGEWRILFQIVLPLAKPILATIALFFAGGWWNEWFSSMIFLRGQQIMPLQLILRSIIINAQFTSTQAASAGSILVVVFSKGIKMAAVTATMAPVMIVYPFLQRYFVKGITLGAVKT